MYVNVYSINATNYFSLLSFGNGATLDSNGAIRNNGVFLTPNQAYSMDIKIDNGLPQSGIVTAQYQQWDISLEGVVNRGVVWAAGGQVQGANSGSPSYGITNSSTPSSATTCYDNAGGAGEQKYSVGYDGGNGKNCALSFRFY